MIQIKVNGANVPLMRAVQVVETVEIVHASMVPMSIPKTHTRPILDWIYDLALRAETVTYNGNVIEHENILSPEDCIKNS